MKILDKPATLVARVLVSLALFAFIATGCALIDSPSASNASGESEVPLWIPQPGDQIIPGHEVPILNPGYWGPTVNPLMIPPRVIHVGADGGVIQLGPHTLSIPAGAVNADITFTLASGSPNAVAVDCGPSGLTFTTPVTLTLSYRNTQYDGSDRALDLRIMFMAPDGSVTPLPTVVDPVNETLTAPLSHFSRYIIA